MDRTQNQAPVKDVTPEKGGMFNLISNKMEITGVKIATATAIALGSLSLAACATGRGEAAPAPTTSTSTEAEPSVTPTPIETEAPSAFEAAMVGEPLKQTMTYEQMKSLTVTEHANLGFADRFAFDLHVFGDEAVRKFDSSTEEQDFLNNPDFKKQLPNHLWGYILGTSYNDGDADTRAKLVGGYRYYTTTKGTEDISDSYQSTIDSVVANGGEGIGGDYVYDVTDISEMHHGEDRDGNPIDYINFTYRGGSEATVDSAPEQTTQAIRTEIELLDGSTVIFYAAGYGIEGHNSPDSRYEY